jgi:uncharacterized membrane protein YhaH (DUF805 family)
MNYYLEVLKKYAVFQGRARRSEYWYFILFNFIFCIVLGIISLIPGFVFLYFLYALAMFIPSLAVGVRRLHDTNRSGWNYFFVLIPIVGSIILIVFLATEGNQGTNQYGPDPKNNDGRTYNDPTIIDSNVI